MSIKSSNSTKSTAQNRRAARFTLDLSFPMIFCTVEGILLFALLAVLGASLDLDQNYSLISPLILAFLGVYALTAGFVCIFYLVKFVKLKKINREARQLETEIYDMFRYIIDMPYAVVDRDGKVKVINGALQDILGYKNAVSGISLSAFCSVPMQVIAAGAKNKDSYIQEAIYSLPGDATLPQVAITKLSDGRRYEVVPYVFKVRGENYYFTVFKDTEDYLSALEREESEATVVAFIILDNLQELTQYVRADYRTASAEAENIIKSWVAEMNGFIREYENDKYIAVFAKKELEKQMLLDFDIQRKIMSLKIGDNSFPVTVSMGIASIRGTLKEKENAAMGALNIAVQRGGNQVAIKREDTNGYVFFGGTHKTIENDTVIASRVSGEILEKHIAKASRVLIMGHANPDFDSVGSCVGMARFSMSVIDRFHADKAQADRPRVNVVINKKVETFETCYAQLAPLGIYEDVFISADDARDLVTGDTLLIICDVNNPYIFESQDLARSASTIAVVDHHRLAAALPFEPFLQYIETTKSSASEIVAEIISQSPYRDQLHKEEAEVLLSGIMLDTNNYTRNAGAQTFEITHYLYTRGAHTGVVREFFNESLEELMLTGEFESKARIYRDSVAITWMALDRPSTPADRIVASKVADKLLTLKGVEASFALVKMDNDVVISGRSKGGINVQLILERLKGGGHFDIAGAQVKNSSLTKTFEMLKDAIDDYFEYDHRQKNQ